MAGVPPSFVATSCEAEALGFLAAGGLMTREQISKALALGADITYEVACSNPIYSEQLNVFEREIDFVHLHFTNKQIT